MNKFNISGNAIILFYSKTNTTGDTGTVYPSGITAFSAGLNKENPVISLLQGR